MSKNLLKNILKGLIFLGLGLALLYLIYYQIDKAYQEQCILDGIPKESCNLIDKLISDFKSAKIQWLLIVLTCYILSCVSRALRWKQLLEPLGYKISSVNAFGTIMVGYFANLGVPRLGELVRPALLSKYENIPIEKVFGTVFIDRAIDVLMLGLFILLAFVVSFETLINMFTELGAGTGLQQKYSLLSYGLGLFILFGIGVYLIKKYSLFRGIINNINKLLSGFLDGLFSIKKLKNPALFIFYTIFMWAMYLIMPYIGFNAFGPTVGLEFETGLIIFILGSMGMVIPTPGGMGSYHYLIMMGLTFYGVNEFDGFSFAMILFILIHLFGNTLFGLLSLLILPFYNKNHSTEKLKH